MELNETDKKIYREELLGFLPREIIDIHTHVWLPEHNGGEAGNASSLASWPDRVAASCPIEELLSDFAALLPGKAVTPLIFGMPTKPLPAVNAYAARSAERYGLPALCCTRWDEPASELEKALKVGPFCGIKPYLNNSPAYIPANELRIYDFLPKEHLEVCDALGAVVMLHIPRSGRLADQVNIAQLLEIEKNYKNLRLIVAHIGRAYTAPDYEGVFARLRGAERMSFDFAANCCEGAIEACLRAVGPSRLLYGTDMPITKMRMYRVEEGGNYVNVVPRGLYGDVSADPHMRESDEAGITLFIYEELRAFRRAALALGLSQSDVEKVMHANAAEILGR